MRCPCCDWNLEYKGGENKEDFGCKNPQCPARTEASYFPHVGVRENWWFATMYHLPFKHGPQWYCLEGPVKAWYIKDKRSLAEQLWPGSTSRYQPHAVTILKKIIPTSHKTCVQEKVWEADYMALPVSQDFNREFDVLINKFDRYLNKLISLL